VLFTGPDAKGVSQSVGFTQDNKVYPLVKCDREESLQRVVNDLLTPEEGYKEQVWGPGGTDGGRRELRELTRTEKKNILNRRQLRERRERIQRKAAKRPRREKTKILTTDGGAGARPAIGSWTRSGAPLQPNWRSGRGCVPGAKS
jgi:hypothetical protein